MPDWTVKRGKSRRPKARLSVEGDPALRWRNAWESLADIVAVRLPHALLLTILTWIVMLGLTSSGMVISQVTVTGNRLVPADEIVQRANLVGQNVFLTNTRQTVQAVLAIKPLTSAHVTYLWPNAVRIDVVERRAAYIWKVDPTLYLVSDEGIVLGTTPTEEGLLVVVDSESRSVAIGDLLDRDALDAAAELRDALTRLAGITPRYFEYTREYGVILPTDLGFRVAFGTEGDFRQKARTLKAIVDDLASRKVSAQFIDLRIADRPYIR